MSDERTNGGTVSGRVEHIGDVQTFASGFSKRELVVNTGGDYPQTIPILFLKARADMIEGYAVGDEVRVAVNFGGREYQGRYFAEFTGWHIKGEPSGCAEDGAPSHTPATPAFGGTTTDGGDTTTDGGDGGQDNLPF